MINPKASLPETIHLNGKKLVRSVMREQPLLSVIAWCDGDCSELEKWLGWSFSNHLFVGTNGKTTLYYDKEEGDKFHEILEKNLDEELFDRLCRDFLELTQKDITNPSNKEIYEIMVKCWPALTIFDEISNYPELVSESMLLRLIRIRKKTQDFAYELENQIKSTDEPEHYLYYKGKLIKKQLSDFLELTDNE